ncbi:unnamed protein product [Sympodiomycopsis kandeliae]
MAPKRRAQASKEDGKKAAEKESSPEPEREERAQSADEKALDPTLAEHPDVSDGEMAQPTPAKKRKTGSSKAKSESNGNANGAAKASSASGKETSKPGQNGDNTVDAKQSDWNPTPGKLPQDQTPVDKLRDALKKQGQPKADAKDGKNVLYLMGMKSLRLEDNRGLAYASELAEKRRKASKEGGNLILMFFISPADWKFHNRSARRIDFVLRNLREIKKAAEDLNIPLVVRTERTRKTLPKTLIDFAKKYNVAEIVGNVEYEVDECWRDTAIVEAAGKEGLHASFLEDAYVVPAGHISTKDGRQYSVFSPWNRAWSAHLSSNLDLLDESPKPEANDKSIRSGPLKELFSLDKDPFGIPASVEGFEIKDEEYMSKLWPAGSEAGRTVLDNFLRRKGGENGMEEPATGASWDDVGPGAKDSRISRYGIGRNLMSENGTSRISPYLAAGVLSPRACLRATMALDKNKLKVGRDTGTEMWNTEISFRDFYGHVLAAWPRVCMNRAYILKYENVVWEYDEDMFKKWTDGQTGYPIVDAAMRQANKQGYMHNRGRMQVAMFLTKHLMLPWTWGEKYFNETLIDQDFASNNAGWQWSASTGTDPQPYFRIFNPLSQSEKCDPRGDYIRHWVPELKDVQGNAIHDPFHRLGEKEFQKLGYPKPIIEHKEGRERALRRFKDPGTK